MSVHSDCGGDIFWVRRSDDPERWMPPLEFAGYRYVITGDEPERTAIQVPTYIMHNCNPEKIEAWQEYQFKLAQLKNHKPDPWNWNDTLSG